MTSTNNTSRPGHAIETLALQGAVIVAAESQYRRMQQVYAAANAHTPDAAPGHVPQTFNEFLDALIVRGLCQMAPRLLECQRLVGQVEPMADDPALLLTTLADETGRLADGLTAIFAAAAPGSFERLAVRTLQDTATMLAACAAGLGEREAGR